jgi:hypothetical protein
MDYEIKTEIIDEDDATIEDFIIGVVWGELPEDDLRPPKVIIERSYFGAKLTNEEINIIALIMVHSWL